MHKVFTVNTLRRYHKLWFHRKVIGTNATVGKCTLFRKSDVPQATIQHVRRQRISKRVDNKRKKMLFDQKPIYLYISFAFSFIDMHYLKRFPIVSGQKRLCLSVIFN